MLTLALFAATAVSLPMQVAPRDTLDIFRLESIALSKLVTTLVDEQAVIPPGGRIAIDRPSFEGNVLLGTSRRSWGSVERINGRAVVSRGNATANDACRPASRCIGSREVLISLDRTMQGVDGGGVFRFTANIQPGEAGEGPTLGATYEVAVTSRGEVRYIQKIRGT